jgi:hypothetical protein
MDTNTENRSKNIRINNVRDQKRSLLSPDSNNLVDGYMSKSGFFLEGKDTIGTGFNCSLESVWSTTIHIYIFLQVMFYYERLHKVYLLLINRTMKRESYFYSKKEKI